MISEREVVSQIFKEKSKLGRDLPRELECLRLAQRVIIEGDDRRIFPVCGMLYPSADDVYFHSISPALFFAYAGLNIRSLLEVFQYNFVAGMYVGGLTQDGGEILSRSIGCSIEFRTPRRTVVVDFQDRMMA